MSSRSNVPIITNPGVNATFGPIAATEMVTPSASTMTQPPSGGRQPRLAAVTDASTKRPEPTRADCLARRRVEWFPALGLSIMIHVAAAAWIDYSAIPASPESPPTNPIRISLGLATPPGGTALALEAEEQSSSRPPAADFSSPSDPGPDTEIVRQLPGKAGGSRHPVDHARRSESIASAPVKGIAALLAPETVGAARLNPVPPLAASTSGFMNGDHAQTDRTGDTGVGDTGFTERASVSDAVVDSTPAIQNATTATTDGIEGRSSSRDAAQGQRAEYALAVQTRLIDHRSYPRRAQLRRQQGVARLFFALDRDGRVIESRIDQSSGYSLLDAEALAMVERAQPFPPLPDGLARSRLELVVPIQFDLR